MHRKFAFIAAIIMLLSACGSTVQESPPVEARVLTIAIQNGISDTAKQALDGFAENVKALSQGALEIETEYCDDVIAALGDGCDIIYADNAEIARADSDFLMFTSPFFFYGYTHMTTTLNSDSFGEEINERLTSLLGAAPLAAFYGGSRSVVSNESEFLDVWDAWQGVSVTISRDSSLLSVVLKAFGANVTERDDETIFPAFSDGDYRTVECDTERLAEISDTRIKNARVYAYSSFHTADIGWLMLSAKTGEALSDIERSAVEEAAAIALAQNDTSVLSRESAAYDNLEKLGVPIFEMEYDEFNAQVCEIFRSEVRYRNLWDWNVYDTLRTMTVID